MLDKQDLQAIGTIVKEVVREEIHVLDIRIAKVETKIVSLEEKIDKVEKNIIHAVGEMLEDNVFPQFEEVHRELRRLNTLVAQR